MSIERFELVLFLLFAEMILIVAYFILFECIAPARQKKGKIICISVFVVMIIVIVFIGFILNARIPECDNNGHQYEKNPYYDVFEKRLELENVVTDKEYEGYLQGNLNEDAWGVFFVYHSTTNETVNGELHQKEEYKFYYKTRNGGYKKSSIPVDYTTIYYIEDGESPYIEQYQEYGNLKKCAVCGEEKYDWKATVYKLYVPKGSITEEIDIH